MTINDMIRDKKRQYVINKEVALLSGKIYKYKYPTGEEILPSSQRQVVEQAKSAFSASEKGFEKETEKQVVLQSLSTFLIKKIN